MSVACSNQTAPSLEINGARSILDFRTVEYPAWTYWTPFTRLTNKRQQNTFSVAETSMVLLEEYQMLSLTALMCSAVLEPWRSQALSTPSINNWSLNGFVKGKRTREDSTVGLKNCQMCVIPGGSTQQCAWWRSKTGSISKPLKTSFYIVKMSKEESAIDQETQSMSSIPSSASLLFLYFSQKNMDWAPLTQPTPYLKVALLSWPISIYDINKIK